MKTTLRFFTAFLLLGWGVTPAIADEYEATVTTDSGTYTVPVEVEDGEVTKVDWPNGGRMNVTGADIDDGEADGTNLEGDSIHIVLLNQASESDDNPADSSADSSDEGDDD